MTQSKCVTSAQGTKWWYNEDNELHRLDGPAVEYAGHRQWWVNNRWHRLDGPAIEGSPGMTEWYIKGVALTQEEFEQHPLVVFYRLCKGNV
jgi:hypothetical protein